MKVRLGYGGHCSVICGVCIGQVRLGQVKAATVRSDGGVCIGEVRLGQINMANYCVPPFTILVSITLGYSLKRIFGFQKDLKV
jgi:hypothetical protein